MIIYKIEIKIYRYSILLRMSVSFKLLSFNPYDNIGEEQDEKEFIVQTFGINERGETISLFVKNYSPFFYVKISNEWNKSHATAFISQLKNDMGKYYEDSIEKHILVKRKKLYGFDGGKKHSFLLIKFKNETALKKAKNLWYCTTNRNGNYQRKLNPRGYEFDGFGTQLYEAQIPPLLRMFHIQCISPSGWVMLPKKRMQKSKTTLTSCTFEFSIDYKDIIPPPNKETRVPYKIASFDIEALPALPA